MRVEIRLRREELLYDVGNYGYIEGHLVGEGAETGAVRHLLEDVCQGGNEDRVGRVLDLAHAAAVELLYPYTKEEVSRGVVDDVPREGEAWVLRLELPEGFSQTSVDYLTRLLHEWLVCRVMWDWVGITRPEKAAVWMEKLEGIEGEIRALANTRRGRSRIRLHPF